MNFEHSLPDSLDVKLPGSVGATSLTVTSYTFGDLKTAAKFVPQQLVCNVKDIDCAGGHANILTCMVNFCLNIKSSHSDRDKVTEVVGHWQYT